MRRKLAVLIAGVLLQVTAAAAQSPSLARKVFNSDTLNIISPTVSPDERWLVFVRLISNQESRVMIQPLAGGNPRELLGSSGTTFYSPRFTPQGDRIVLVSNLPKRSPADDRSYLVGVPFDTRTGVLSGPPRQISLEGVRPGPRTPPVISPDGRLVAYVSCCGSNAVKIVPITGGNARTLVELPSNSVFYFAWSPDGKHLFYEVVDVQGSVRMRISLEGSAPTETARSKDRLGALSPDNRSSFMVERGAGPESTLRFFAANGRLMGEAALPPGFNPAFAAYAANGKYIIGQTANAVAPIKLVAVAGGPIHQLTRGDVYDWPGGWSDGGDSSYVMTEEQGHPAVAIVTRNGATSRTIRVPEDAPVTTYIGLKDGYLVYRAGERRTAAEWRLMAMSLENGSRKELARGVMVGGGNICCFPKPAGGMYYGITGSEFYFRQLVGNRLQIRAMRVSGQSRLLGDFPASLLGKTGFALYQDRIAYLEPVKDSVRLQMVTGAGRPPKTLDTFGKGGVEFAWSHDGRQLAVSVGNPWKLLVYRFDAAGALQGSPQTITLPFEYWYETFWLPDGSGLTMIAQPRGKGTTDVALVKLADPEHPILLTRDDPASKWGHSLSPDGKYVAYPSEQLKGSSIYLIEVAELLKQVQTRK